MPPFCVILEAPWFSSEDLRIPTSTGRTVVVDRIDMRLEDLRRYGGVQIRDVYQWLAPYEGGRFLTHDHGVVSAERGRELGWWVLPGDWWEYALGTKDGIIVKAPKHPRPGEPTQEEADAQEPASATFESRLDAVLRRPLI